MIISEFTNSSFTLVMSKAGAVVTEIGGTLSHAAIVCRESKVPCYKLYKCHENYPRRRSCDCRWNDGIVTVLNRRQEDLNCNNLQRECLVCFPGSFSE